jgi:uncharacterized delta-60 repeat protein
MWFFSPRKARRTPSARRPHSPYRPRLEALEDRCCPSSGALDPTFGSGGIVTTALIQKNSVGSISATGVLLQPNGDIIAYGYFEGNKFIKGGGGVMARYTPTGRLDTTFGSNGFVVTPNVVLRAALQSNGKIVTLLNGGNVDRYNSNGSLDTTFGSNGVVGVPFNTVFNDDAGLLIQPSNDDIVVGGGIYSNTADSPFALVRYTANGTLDPTFGNGGEVVTPIAGKDAYINSLALENGDIVAGGWWNSGPPTAYGWALARYTLSGSLDTTFGSGGIVTIPAPTPPTENTTSSIRSSITPDNITSLLVQPNGQIVAVGYASNGYGCWALARFNSDGTLDGTFGSGGIVTSAPAGNDMALGAALQSNGQIAVVGGQAQGGQAAGYDHGSSFEVGVYNTDGSLDSSFGSGGFVIQTTTEGATADGVVIQPDGKIVVAGSVLLGSTGPTYSPEDFMLARYGPSAAQIGSFTASPNPVAAGSTVTLTASNITLADRSSTITQVAFYVQVNGTNTLLGYGTQNSPGIWTFNYTVNLASGNYTLIAQAKDSDGVFSDPVALSLQVV